MWLQVKRFQSDEEINLDDEDIEFIVQQVWKSRCAVTQKRFGGHIMLTLTRWHAHLPPTRDNLVLIMQDEAAKLAEQGSSAFPVETVERIESRLAWAREVLRRDDEFDNQEGLMALTKSELRRKATTTQQKQQVLQQRDILLSGNLLLGLLACVCEIVKC